MMENHYDDGEDESPIAQRRRVEYFGLNAKSRKKLRRRGGGLSNRDNCKPHLIEAGPQNAGKSRVMFEDDLAFVKMATGVDNSSEPGVEQRRRLGQHGLVG